MILSTGANAADWTINPYGYGPVKVGMTLKQAEKVLMTKLIPDGDGVNAECYHAHPMRGHKGLLLMVESNKITRASLYRGASAIKTDKGITIGDSEKKVLRTYDNHLAIEPHQYGGTEDQYMTHWIKGKKFGVRYETLQGVVDTIHGGSSAIQYIEGCS